LGASTGVISALRALGENAWLLRVRVVSGVVLVVLSVPASAHYGAAGALVALSASEWTVALLAWTRLDQVLEWRGQGPVLITGPTTGPWRGQVGPPDEG
jgi:O-antigen/teichoic acid export membrane protein